MITLPSLKLLPRMTALLIWLLVGLGLAYALLQLRQGAGVPAEARTLPTAAVAAGDWQRVMGQPQAAAQPEAAPAPALAQRLRLLGIVSGSRRAALMSLDGKLPRVWRPGDALDENYVVQHIGLRDLRAARKDDASVTFQLELPLLPPPATGVPGQAPAQGAAPAGAAVAPPVIPVPAATPQPAPAPQTAASLLQGNMMAPAMGGEAPKGDPTQPPAQNPASASAQNPAQNPAVQPGTSRMGMGGGLLPTPQVPGGQVIPEMAGGARQP